MKRWLLILLCALLPLQLAWASAVGLCGEHQASAAAHCLQQGDAGPVDAGGSLGMDSGCDHCQAHGAPPLQELALAGAERLSDAALTRSAARPPAPPPERPERPNWRCRA
jgi:hypothetical protein